MKRWGGDVAIIYFRKGCSRTLRRLMVVWLGWKICHFDWEISAFFLCLNCQALKMDKWRKAYDPRQELEKENQLWMLIDHSYIKKMKNENGWEHKPISHYNVRQMWRKYLQMWSCFLHKRMSRGSLGQADVRVQYQNLWIIIVIFFMLV